ncbi:MAG: YraN family protein [Bacteroidales bacterium]
MDKELIGFSRQAVGRRGEDIANTYLKALGCKVVARNWYSGHNELDIVVEEPCFIRFVEVRTLVYPNVVEPFETIGILKQQKVIKAARAFIVKNRINKEVVFDVVSIVLNGNDFRLEYIKNAFTPLW